MYPVYSFLMGIKTMLRLLNALIPAVPIVLSLALITCSGPADTSDPPGEEALLGVVWDFDLYQSPDTSMLTPFWGYATLHFMEDLLVRGHSGGLTSYHGVYSIPGDDSLSIEILEPAELGCSPPSMPCFFIDALKIVTTYDVHEEELTLHTSEQSVLTFHATRYNEVEFLDVMWKADSLRTPDIWIGHERDSAIIIIQGYDTTRLYDEYSFLMTIQFGDDMLLDGFLISNYHAGAYLFAGPETFLIDTRQMTGVGCDRDDPEALIAEAFNNVTAYHVVENQLRLQSTDGSYLIDLRPKSSFEPLAVQNIAVDCVSGVLSRGPNDIVITTQEEYEQFLDWKFKQRLDGTWDYHFPNVLEVFMRKYPGLTESEYVQLATDSLLRMEVFIWAKNCGYPDGGPLYGNPEIDFNTYTLLGARIEGGGCSGPEIDLLEAIIDAEQMKYVYRIHIIWHGSCEMALYGLVWVLVPRLPEGYTVEFVRLSTRDY